MISTKICFLPHPHWLSSSHSPLILIIPIILLLLLGLTTNSALALTPTLTDLRCVKAINLTGPCVPLNDSICMGGALPFKFTSVDLARDSTNLSEVYAKLQLWAGLKNVPQCWSVVQPFLCSVYLPKCDDSKGVELPSKELCERVRKPCKIVADVKGWPDFLKCDDPNFVSGCKTDTYDKLVFNTSGKCEHPLVRTNNPDSWFEGVEGCGIPCDSPLFTEAQHDEVHIFVAVFGSICLVCTLFTVLTFIIDWKNANRYPALILFFINTCFFLGSVGWMAQFAGDARRDIVCRSDGTIRKGEPKLGSNETISCTMVFVIVYYFLVAGMSWFVMLAYAWYLTFVSLGTPRDGLTSKTAYFHLVSWCSPLVLTIICLAISEVDGDSVSGICFVGGLNHSVRAVFVLVPVGLVILVGTFFLLRGVYTLIQIRKEAPVFIPEKTFSKIRDTIIRLGIFTTMALVFVIITFAVHVYIFANEDKWKESFREYMYCIANVSVTAHSESSPNARSSASTGGRCELEEKPSLVAMEIHIFAFFGAGIAMSSWSWTKSSLAAWERFFRWIFHKPSNKPVRLKRHRMIAQAFEKRKEINQGRVSISYRSSHDDPLGMKFDLNSCSDDDLSSTFAMAMPKLVCRRGGLIYPSPGIGRRYSDSDVQSVISTRRVSRESQFLEFREAQFVVFDRDELPCDPYGKKSRKKLKKKKGKLNRIKPVMGPMFTGPGGFKAATGSRNNMMMMMQHRRRKESDSSAISQMSIGQGGIHHQPHPHHHHHHPLPHQAMMMKKRCNSMETVSMASNNNNYNEEEDHGEDVILPAVTKSSNSNSVVLDKDSSTLRMHQFLKELKKDHHGGGGGSNGKERIMGLSGAGGGGALVGGRGGAHVGMKEATLHLPGAVDVEEEEEEELDEDTLDTEEEEEEKKLQQQQQQQFMNQRARRQSVAVGLPGMNGLNAAATATPSSARKSSKNNTGNHHNNQSSASSTQQKSTKNNNNNKGSNNRCVKTMSSSSTTTFQKKKKTKMTTTMMEAAAASGMGGLGGGVGGGGGGMVDLSCIPFSPLMADIGGGNWGVLLGKSGSSSGSEAGVGGGGYGGYVSGGSFYRPITHNLTPHHTHNLNHYDQQNNLLTNLTNPHAKVMRESAFHPIHSNSHSHNPSNDRNNMQFYNDFNAHPYHYPHPQYSGGGGIGGYEMTNGYNRHFNGYPPSSYAGSPTDVLYGGGGYASNYMPGSSVPHMGGSTKPISFIDGASSGNQYHHPHHHQLQQQQQHHHHHNGKSQQQLRQQVSHSNSHGGARPKKVPLQLQENLGHFPAHLFYNGNNGSSGGNNNNINSNNNHQRQRIAGKQFQQPSHNNKNNKTQKTSTNNNNANASSVQHRPMKGPNHSFFNSTFEVDDDVESISA